jgi:hypothetical protein
MKSARKRNGRFFFACLGQEKTGLAYRFVRLTN